MAYIINGIRCMANGVVKKTMDLEIDCDWSKYDIAFYKSGSGLATFYYCMTSPEFRNNNLTSQFLTFGNRSGGDVVNRMPFLSDFYISEGVYANNYAFYSQCYSDEYLNTGVFNVYVFPTKLQCAEYLLKESKELKDAYARDNALNEVKAPDPYINFDVYLSKEKSPLIDIVWKLMDNGNNDVTWDKMTIYYQVMQGVLPSEVKKYTEINASEIHFSTTFDGVTGAVRQLFPILSIATNVYRIFIECDYHLGILPKMTSRAWFQVQSINNSTSNQHGIVYQLDDSTITLKMGYAEDDEEYQEYIDTISPFTPPSDSGGYGYSSNGIGCRQYVMSKTKINDLFSWLWSSNFIENVKKVQQNPIENIVSCKIFPFDFSSSENVQIKIGNVNTEITTGKLPINYNAIRTVADFQVTEKYGNFLDYTHTKIYIYLPFIGIKELDNIVMGRTLKVQYVVDVTTGMCNCQIYVDGVLMYKYSGMMGIDIPLSSNNRVELEKSYIQSAVSTVGAVATENYGGAFASALNGALSSAHTSTSGGFSPNCEGYSDRHIYLIYDRPQHQASSQYFHVNGAPCNLSLNLSNLKGYTELSDGVDLSGIPCNSEEMDMLRDILTSGFYL